jgi:hypothetical protein
MSQPVSDQWVRKIGLFVYGFSTSLDLSDMHIKFQIENAQIETPNNATIRVYNLSDATIKQIQGEFSQVILNAGYEGGDNYGAIFQGQIKQFRIGRENATDTYLDILAADGDIGYNQGFVNETLAAGHTPQQAIDSITGAMPNVSVDYSNLSNQLQYNTNPRSAIFFGMARAKLRYVANSLNAQWSIQNGVVVILDKTGYLPDDILEINSGTGMISQPEQTEDGIKVQCLLNPKIRLGGRIKLNNEAINQMMQRDPSSAPVSYNSRAGIYFLTPVSGDGVYQAFAITHEGDNRGQPWYTHLVCLAVNPSATAGQEIRSL